MYLTVTAQQIASAAKSCDETSWVNNAAPETKVEVFSLPFVNFNKKYYKCYLGEAPNRRWVGSIPQEWFDVIFIEGAR